MARSYHAEIARLAAGADAKWVDNLLSRFSLPGVEGGRQGVARRLTLRAINHVALTRRLTADLRLNVGDAVTIAGQLLGTNGASVRFGGHLTLLLDRDAFEREIERATLEAAESMAPMKRGRPPARAAAGP